MLNAFILKEDGAVSRDTSPEALAAALRDPKCTFWLDMSTPTEDELALLDEVFGFHPLAIEDTIGRMQRPKIENYNHVGQGCAHGYFYMVLHGPDLESFRQNLRTKELDIFCSQQYLVTIHDEPMRSIETALNRTIGDPKRILSRGIDLLLHNILDYLVDLYDPILDYLEEAIDELEEQALANPAPDLLNKIATKKRDLLNLRRVVGPQREVIAQLTRGEVPFIRESTRIYLRDVQDHLIRIVEMVELYRDLVMGARDIYLSSISNNMNQVMKTLTTISVIGLPLTIITGFFGMNFDALPGIHKASTFWITVVFMMMAVAGMLMFFRVKKWI